MSEAPKVEVVGFSDPWNTYEHRVVFTFFYALAVVLTLCRLARRIRIRRFSWDDSWAAFALALLLVKMAIDWSRVNHSAEPRTDSVHDVAKFKAETKIYYTVKTSLFSAIVWSSRVSLALSTVRILPPGRLRKTAIGVSVACFLFGVMLITLKCAICRVIFLPSGRPFPLCTGGTIALGIQTAGDIISSLVLVSFPLYALRLTSHELPLHERRLLYALFASTILTLAACLTQAIFVAKMDRFATSYSGMLETAISLMVCNLLVVVTFLYQVFSRRKDDREYNSGEDTITLATMTRTESQGRLRARTNSITSVQSQLTELGEMQTYSLRSLDIAASGTGTSGVHSRSRT